MSVDGRMKAIEQNLANLKLGSDEKDNLREILGKGDNAETREQIHTFLKELQEKNKGKYKAEKDIKKLTPLYDTHDFWDQ